MAQTPIQIYQAKIQNGLLHKDEKQESAVQALNTLFVDILSAYIDKQGIWGAIKSFFRPKGKNAPKGLYIYGGVGRGKSMLMDLFYECLPGELKKRRIHFHEFMIEVHEYFHSRREEGDIDVGVDGLIPSLSSIIASR